MNLKIVMLFAFALLWMVACENKNSKTEETENTQKLRKILTDPLVYDATIIAELVHINHGLSAILDQISAADSLGILREYNTTKVLLDEGIEKLKDLPTLDGNVDYKGAALNIMNFHRKAMDSQYKRIVEISVKKNPSEKEEEERETLYEQMENVEEDLDDRFFRVRDAFGKQNNIKLPNNGDVKL